MLKNLHSKDRSNSLRSASFHQWRGYRFCDNPHTIEALGHQIKVACPSTRWRPKTFLAKLFGIIELRHASHEDVLGILLDRPSHVEGTLGLAPEDRRSKVQRPTKRQKVA